jgi:hypothetical protein
LIRRGQGQRRKSGYKSANEQTRRT